MTDKRKKKKDEDDDFDIDLDLDGFDDLDLEIDPAKVSKEVNKGITDGIAQGTKEGTREGLKPVAKDVAKRVIKQVLAPQYSNKVNMDPLDETINKMSKVAQIKALEKVLSPQPERPKRPQFAPPPPKQSVSDKLKELVSTLTALGYGPEEIKRIIDPKMILASEHPELLPLISSTKMTNASRKV